jgi:short-subunit dehydrogenase
VAEFGYKKSLKGKTLAVVGFKNRLTVFASRFVPRKFIAKTSAKTMKKQ